MRVGIAETHTHTHTGKGAGEGEGRKELKKLNPHSRTVTYSVVTQQVF